MPSPEQMIQNLIAPIHPQLRLNPIPTICSDRYLVEKEMAEPTEKLDSETKSDSVVKKSKLSKKRRQKLKSKALDNANGEHPNEEEIIDKHDENEIKADSEPNEKPNEASNLESVLEYFDSVEQENRCLKMGQEFMQPLLKENKKL